MLPSGVIVDNDSFVSSLASGLNSPHLKFAIITNLFLLDRCDGWIDCSDGTDERNCSASEDLPHPCSCGYQCDPIGSFTYETDSGTSVTIHIAFSHFSDNGKAILMINLELLFITVDTVIVYVTLIIRPSLHWT